MKKLNLQFCYNKLLNTNNGRKSSNNKIFDFKYK